MNDSEKFAIVVRAPNWIGDAVMAEPVFRLIKEAYPLSKVSCLATDAICELYQNHPQIDAFLPFSRTKKEKKKEYRHITELLKKSSFDIGLLLTGSFSSAWQFYRAKIARRIGFATHARSFLLTDSLNDTPANCHLVASYKSLLKPLGISAGNDEPQLFLSNSEKNKLTSLYKNAALKKMTILLDSIQEPPMGWQNVGPKNIMQP